MARILIIDAAGDVAAAVEAGLADESYVLERRASWDPADARSIAPDLVVIGLPGTSGGAAPLTRALVARPELAGVPLLAAGSREREGELLACLEAGASDCLLVPTHPRMLRARVLVGCAAAELMRRVFEVDSRCVRRWPPPQPPDA